MATCVETREASDYSCFYKGCAHVRAASRRTCFRFPIGSGGLWSKRRHRNGDRNGYIQSGDKPKQHLQF